MTAADETRSGWPYGTPVATTARTAPAMTDTEIVDTIARLLSAEEWPGASAIEDVQAIVAEGRVIIDDPDVIWHAH